MKHIPSSISYGEIWQIAYPIIFGNLAQTLLTLIDTAFLGHMGRVELGAAMMAGLFYFTFSTLAWGFALGVQIVTARRFGEGNLKQVGVVFQHGLVGVAGIALLLFSLMHFLTTPLLHSIIDSPAIYEQAMIFMKYRHFGILFVCFNYLYRSLYIGISRTKIITFSTLLMASINIVLDYCLIFGNWGFPEMKIGGAALASVIAEFCGLSFFTLMTLFNQRIKQFALFVKHKTETALLKALLSLSIPTMLQRLLTFGTWFLFFALIERMGELPIAISGVVRSVYMLMLVPVFAFGATANTLTSRLIGSGKQSEIATTLRKVLKSCLLMIIPIIVLVLVIPSYILSIYSTDMELIASSIPTLYVVCLATVIMAFGMVYFEAVSGTGNTKIALFMELANMAIYIFYIFLLTRMLHASIAAVWTSEYVYAGLIGLISIIYLKYGNWKKKVI